MKNNNALIFLRHAETKKDSKIPIKQWRLTFEGKENVQNLTSTGIFDTVDIIISSQEIKAYQSALPLAKRLNKKVHRIKGLGEINREGGGVMSKEDYDTTKEKIFTDLDFRVHGWETARHALHRFKKAVEKINRTHKGKKILISSHGTVMTLYFAFLSKDMKNLMKRWKSLGFCDYGLVCNNKVVKDVK